MKNKHLLRVLSVILVSILFANSIGYAKDLDNPIATSNCGEWRIESSSLPNDQRLSVELARQVTDNDCAGLFTLSNQTSTIIGGGYAVELKAASNNADIQYLPKGDAILIPGLDVDAKTIPLNSSQVASIVIRGEVTAGTILLIDLPLFVLRATLEAVDVPTGCLISYDQINLIALRAGPILENAGRLALQNKLIESKEEFSRVITEFYEKSGDVALDLGIGCFSDYLKSIIKKPYVIFKISLEYTLWIGKFFYDYIKYSGTPPFISISYIPRSVSYCPLQIQGTYNFPRNIVKSFSMGPGKYLFYDAPGGGRYSNDQAGCELSPDCTQLRAINKDSADPNPQGVFGPWVESKTGVSTAQWRDFIVRCSLAK